MLNLDLEIDLHHKILDRLSTHFGGELIAKFFHRLVVLLVVEELSMLERRETWVCDHIGLKVQDAFDVTERHVQQQTNPGGK